MSSILNPYLTFDGKAREAMEFYQSVFGGDLTMTTYEEFQMGDPGEGHKLMHAQLITPSGFTLMGADTPNLMEFSPGTSFTVSLSGDDEEELTGYWNALIEGGTVGEPLTKAPWGDSFGMGSDRFGVPWMVNIAGSAA